jgi:hypothetical protein
MRLKKRVGKKHPSEPFFSFEIYYWQTCRYPKKRSTAQKLQHWQFSQEAKPPKRTLCMIQTAEKQKCVILRWMKMATQSRLITDTQD